MAQQFKHPRLIAALLLLSILIFTSISRAQEDPCGVVVPRQVFCDDFSDGSFSDDAPVSWSLQNNHLATRVENEDLQIDGGGFPFMIPNPSSLNDLSNVSIRTQVKLEEGAGIWLSTRRSSPTNAPYGYAAGVYHSPTEDVRIAEIFLWNEPLSVLADTTTSLDLDQELVLQFDAIGDQLALWAWQEGGPLPLTPLVSVTNDLVAEGQVHIGIGGDDPYNNSSPASAVFRYVRVATQPIPIPEPSSALLASLGLLGLLPFGRRR